MLDSSSAIFRSREDYLFVFGGSGVDGSEVTSFEVLDVKCGIWRQFPGFTHRRLGQEESAQVSHALPVPSNALYILTDHQKTIRKFSLNDMRCEEVK